jgi:hypothetical protein
MTKEKDNLEPENQSSHANDAIAKTKRSPSKNNITVGSEEYEEDRSMDLRMKPQPLEQQAINHHKKTK